MTESIRWRRLDSPGHEVAEFAPIEEGWLLSGTATFAESGRPCKLEYTITCDRAFVTRHCSVTGRIGDERVNVDLKRDSASGAWSIDGAPQPALADCIDVDLGFSPSTNLLPIRRLALPIGASADVRAAWVRFSELTLEVLEQRYTRIAPDRYLYESDGGRFCRELIVDDTGFVLEYPGLWTSEVRSSAPAR